MFEFWKDLGFKSLYTPGILKDRQTDDCKTNSSPKFGYFQVAFNARTSDISF